MDWLSTAFAAGQEVFEKQTARSRPKRMRFRNDDMTRPGMTPLVAGGLCRTISVVLIFLFCGPASCGRNEKRQPDTSPEASVPVRPVRVLIASEVERVRIRAEGIITLQDKKRTEPGSYAADEWLTVEPGGSGDIRVGGRSLSIGSAVLAADATGCIRIAISREDEWTGDVEYWGSLRVNVAEDGDIDVVNHVDVEQYVACVVAQEVWPGFEREAYRAQAIAARTYVLYQMGRRRNAAFDVSATEGSQVYKGIRRDEPGRRAAEAAKYTRGIVCTWRDRGEDKLFSTYYNAVCGGVSQSAAIFGKADDIPPLAGGVRCDYCKIARGDTYRWGPVRLSRQEVLGRLMVRYPELAALGDIAAIKVIERAPGGRPVRMRITGSTGRIHDMLAERFRLAIGSMVVKSTDFDIRVTDGDVLFEHGRGFGHGLGLCQWGMQGQALAGKRAGEILRFYYPGSRLTRAY